MIYLDSAATSLYKPESVHYAVLEAMRAAASPGRGSHEPAMRAADICYDCRESLSKLLGVGKSENIVFTLNATHALNIAINSLAERGMPVLVSGWEHNSVIRPLHALDAKISVAASPLFDSEAFLEDFESKLPKAELVVLTHVSNVFGFILPLRRCAELCARRRIPLIVDASQSAGTVELELDSLGAAFVAMPGHKGLMGPQGTGVLVCYERPKPLLYGGTGSASALPTMPESLPDMLEAGTHNVSGIAGLGEGVRYLLKHGVDSVYAHERRLLEVFCAGLEGAEDVRVYLGSSDRQAGVVSLTCGGMSCERLGERLAEEGVAVRAGLHCAPLAHRTAGTFDTGTVRFSFSPFVSVEQAARSAEICKNIINAARKNAYK